MNQNQYPRRSGSGPQKKKRPAQGQASHKKKRPQPNGARPAMQQARQPERAVPQHRPAEKARKPRPEAKQGMRRPVNQAHRPMSSRPAPRPIRRENDAQLAIREIRENPLWLLLFLWAALAWPEFILHAATAREGCFWNAGLLLAPLFALCPAGIVFVLSTWGDHPGFGRFLTWIYALATYVFTGSQLVYYRVFSYFYSVQSMGNAGQVLEFSNIIAKTILHALPLLLLMGLPVLCLLLFGRALFAFHSLGSTKLSLIFLAASLVFQMMVIACLPVIGGTGESSAFTLYHTRSDSYASINRLGQFTAFRLDLQKHLFGKENNSGDIVLAEPSTQPTEPVETEPPTEAPTTPPTEAPTEAPTEPPVDTSPNVLDIDFDSLIENESSDSIKQVHAYFQNRTPSAKNEKTGMFAGDNLIILTAEGFDYLAVDPERTPTLYKLMHEGFLFTNFYTPGWGVSTTDGEYVTLTGTIPDASTFSFADTVGHAMPLTMCEQLTKLGYNAFAYHGHTYNYYDRDKYLENLGYAFKAKGKGLDVTDTWPESDIEVVDLSTADYVDKEPFTTYYMTISGHMLYTFTGNTMASKNKDLVADLPYSDNVRAYMACQIELDRSLELLLQRLEEAGVADNTVIALVADHYPYGLTNEEMNEMAGYELDSLELYRNGCIIYKKGMTPETVDAPCCSMDLLPTLSNLFGLEFDSRLYMGRDVFSDAPPLVIFSNRSWITDRARYNADTGSVKSTTEREVTDEYVESIRNEVSNRFTVSSRILSYDYWRLLFPDE